MALKKTLNLWHLRFYGVGTIVGAGIYSVIGVAAGEAGGALWLSFLIAGATAFLAAQSYAELASLYPRAGAEYQYFRKAYPAFRLPAFLAGLLIALNAAATSATVALAFGGYLKVFLPEFSAPVTAFALLAVCTAVNIAGIRESTWVSIALVCVEVSGLLLIGVAGLALGDLDVSFAVKAEDAGGVFAGAALLFFMFIGFEDVANLSEEAHEPRRNVPRALLDAVIVTTAIYMLVCLGTLTAITPEALAQSDSPLTSAGRELAPWIGLALGITALFATASTGMITLISISRLLYGMARENDLPAAVARLLPGRKSPWVAALILFTAACALLPLGNVKITASVSALGLLSVFTGIHFTVIYLRRKHPRLKRPFRSQPAVAGVPVGAALGIPLSLAFMTQFDASAYAVFAAAVGGGLLLYWLPRGKTVKPRRALAGGHS